ncbi:TetR/AcrR family transcriptional regulator [Granulicella sibirica]|uniref:TetR/AcrR family transcriptional regulator n=1 Tax=Granulicella sibirica TaxID=2479048 RepID=UPI0013763E34|nr:TetR/AcrR family transcriptional regulator [Granulicella sibirica]
MDAAFELIQEKRYDGMTIQLIAEKAGVSSPTVYGIFRSKSGILAELLERASFGQGYDELIRRSRESQSSEQKLRIAASIACHIYQAEGETMNLLSGAGIIRSELERPMEERECRRFDSQEHVVKFIHQRKELKTNLKLTKARDILWSLTSRELFTLHVRKRAWSVGEYEDWLSDALVTALLFEK